MTENSKPYELRPLMADDIFPMFRILSKIGIKEFKDCFASNDVKAIIASMSSEKDKTGNDNIVMSVGIAVVMDIASVIISNVDKCQDDIYLFLSRLSGISKEEMATLPMMTFFNIIIDVIKKDEFKDFFRAVTKLFK